MFLYLIVSPALTVVAAFFLLGGRLDGASIPRGRDEWESLVRNPALAAVGAFIPIYIVYLALSTPDLFQYSLGGLYLRFAIRDYFGWFALLCVAAYATARSRRQRTAGEQYLAHAVFFTVAVTLLSIADVLLHDGVWTAEELFLRPTARALVLVMYPIAVTVADTARGGGWAVVLMVIQPLIAALIPMWFEWLRPGYSLISLAGLVLVTLCGVGFLLFRGAARRGRGFA
ncbi:MAG: hypothetical protein MI724_16340 [Spirochaetales bacterium]|nr:hypothetical protein [Spirochaetales bacterium]